MTTHIGTPWRVSETPFPHTGATADAAAFFARHEMLTWPWRLSIAAIEWEEADEVA